MTEQAWKEKLANCEQVILQNPVKGPGMVAALLYGPDGAAQVRENELVIGYWIGNQDTKVFIKRGVASRSSGRFSTNERWCEAILKAMRKDYNDEK